MSTHKKNNTKNLQRFSKKKNQLFLYLEHGTLFLGNMLRAGIQTVGRGSLLHQGCCCWFSLHLLLLLLLLRGGGCGGGCGGGRGGGIGGATSRALPELLTTKAAS